MIRLVAEEVAAIAGISIFCMSIYVLARVIA